MGLVSYIFINKNILLLTSERMYIQCHVSRYPYSHEYKNVITILINYILCFGLCTVGGTK